MKRGSMGIKSSKRTSGVNSGFPGWNDTHDTPRSSGVPFMNNKGGMPKKNNLQPPKTNIAMENHHFWIGDTFSNACFFPACHVIFLGGARG